MRVAVGGGGMGVGVEVGVNVGVLVGVDVLVGVGVTSLTPVPQAKTGMTKIDTMPARSEVRFIRKFQPQ